MSSPRLRRLKLDAEKLADRFSSWPTIQVKANPGFPPEGYQVTYQLRGLYVGPSGAILERNAHTMEVSLSLAYPRRAPQCKMLTPVFHPNFDDASVCIGDFWAASEGLDDLIIRIGRMIAYQEYNIKSPLNGLAARWAAEHEKLLPVHTGEIAPPYRSLEVSSPDKLVIDLEGGSETLAPSPTASPANHQALASSQRVPVLINCKSGGHVVAGRVPFTVGASSTSEWTGGQHQGLEGELFSIDGRGEAFWLCPLGTDIIFDGQSLEAALEITPGADHTIATNGQFFLLRISGQPERWAQNIEARSWYVHDPDSGVISGPCEWGSLEPLLQNLPMQANLAVVYCAGSEVAFFASQLRTKIAEPPVVRLRI